MTDVTKVEEVQPGTALTFSIIVPDPFCFVSIHQMQNDNWAVCLKVESDKIGGKFIYGFGYHEDINAATLAAVERTMSNLEEFLRNGPNTGVKFVLAPKKKVEVPSIAGLDLSL